MKKTPFARVLACVDVSGTMSEDTIEAIKDRLQRLDETVCGSAGMDMESAIVVVEFSTEVHRVVPLRQWLLDPEQMHGKGGCIYDCIFQDKLLWPDGVPTNSVLIYTDGCGTMTLEKSPVACPVMWLFVGKERHMPAAWGNQFLAVEDLTNSKEPDIAAEAKKRREVRQASYTKKG